MCSTSPRVPSVCHRRRIPASATSGMARKNAESTRPRRTIRPPASVHYALRLIRNQQVAGSNPAGGFVFRSRFLCRFLRGSAWGRRLHTVETTRVEITTRRCSSSCSFQFVALRARPGVACSVAPGAEPRSRANLESEPTSRTLERQKSRALSRNSALSDHPVMRS